MDENYAQQNFRDNITLDWMTNPVYPINRKSSTKQSDQKAKKNTFDRSTLSKWSEFTRNSANKRTIKTHEDLRRGGYSKVVTNNKDQLVFVPNKQLLSKMQQFSKKFPDHEFSQEYNNSKKKRTFCIKIPTHMNFKKFSLNQKLFIVSVMCLLFFALLRFIIQLTTYYYFNIKIKTDEFSSNSQEKKNAELDFNKFFFISFFFNFKSDFLLLSLILLTFFYKKEHNFFQFEKMVMGITFIAILVSILTLYWMSLPSEDFEYEKLSFIENAKLNYTCNEEPQTNWIIIRVLLYFILIYYILKDYINHYTINLF